MERWKRKDTQRRAAVAVLVLLLLLLLWRCGHDGTPSGNGPAADGSRLADDGSTATPACDGLLEHRGWRGRIAFSHGRDIASADGEDHLDYAFVVDVGAELAEKTRREYRGADYVVQYFHPEPRGRVEARMLVERFDNRGLAYRNSFVGDGRLQAFEEGMSEDGSMMSLTVKADCSYTFRLQGQALGTAEVYSRHGDPRPGDLLWLPGVSGSGIARSGSRLSGTRDFKVMSGMHLEETRHLPEQPDWVSERDQVERILGRDNLGTVSVTWDFEALDR